VFKSISSNELKFTLLLTSSKISSYILLVITFAAFNFFLEEIFLSWGFKIESSIKRIKARVHLEAA
jgi:hypothetical protein